MTIHTGHNVDIAGKPLKFPLDKKIKEEYSEINNSKYHSRFSNLTWPNMYYLDGSHAASYQHVR
jgi:hypothetical protein